MKEEFNNMGDEHLVAGPQKPLSGVRIVFIYFLALLLMTCAVLLLVDYDFKDGALGSPIIYLLRS